MFETAGIPLEPELLAALVERTEGWAAALRFAALALRGQGNAESFVLALARSEQALSEYIVSEVLASQPPDLRDFVLRTSLCERIDGELADAVTGGSDGARILASLEPDNVFLELQEDGRSYRYHRLVGALLASQARYELGDEVFGIHRAAARKLAANGDGLAALRHALASGDAALAAETVSGSWLELIGHGEFDLAEALLERADESVIRQNPQLCLLAAWSRVGAGDQAEAGSWLAVADSVAARLDDDERRAFDVARTVLGALHARLIGDLDGVERATAQLVRPESLAVASPAGQGRRAFVLWMRGLAAAWRGDLERAASTLEAAVHRARRASLPDLESEAAGLLALVCALRGELRRAARLAEFAAALVEPAKRPRAQSCRRPRHSLCAAPPGTTRTPRWNTPTGRARLRRRRATRWPPPRPPPCGLPWSSTAPSTRRTPESRWQMSWRRAACRACSSRSSWSCERGWRSGAARLRPRGRS